MPLSVPEKYTDLYIKALIEKKKTLQLKIAQFQTEINEIDSHLNSLTSMPLFEDNKLPISLNFQSNTYQEEWSWTKKIAHYQSVRAKLFRANDVVDFIMEKEPAIKKDKVRSSISAALSNKCKRGELRKFIDPVSGSTYYGLIKYFINQNEPHLEFMPDELKDRLLYNK